MNYHYFRAQGGNDVQDIVGYIMRSLSMWNRPQGPSLGGSIPLVRFKAVGALGNAETPHFMPNSYLPQNG